MSLRTLASYFTNPFFRSSFAIEDHSYGPLSSSSQYFLASFQGFSGFQTAKFLVRLSDSQVSREAGRLSSAAWVAFFVGYLTLQSKLILLSITVVVDTIWAANARRCFRNVIDAHLRQGPDRR